MSTVEAARRELARHIGYREKGTNNTTFNHEFGKLPGYPHDGYGYPWCHTFVSVCLKRAGLRPDVDFPYTAGCLSGVAWFKARHRFGRTPRVGALVYYGPQGGTHVEWVERVTPTHIVTIGGNTSGSLDGQYFNGDGVYRKTIPRSSPRIYGYGYPNYEEDDMPLTDADARKVAKAVIGALTRKVTAGQWAAKEGIFDVGQELDPVSGLRQTWAYGKDTNRRIRALQKTVAAQGATISTLVAALGERDSLNVDELVERIGARVEEALAAHAEPEPTDDVDEPDPEDESDVDETPAPVEPAEG